MERHDAGGFHAWKHVLVGPVIRHRRAVAAVGIAGLLTACTACGSGGQDMGSSTPEVTSSHSPSVSPTATPVGPSTTAGEVVKTDKGEYLQSTISDDDPAMQYDPAKFTDNAKAIFSAEDIQQAQKVGVKFVAEQVIDSPLNNGAVSVDSWWGENQNRFDPAYRASIRANIDNSASPVLLNKWHEERKDTYSYIYDSKETRVYDRLISMNQGSVSEDGSLVVIEGEFSFKAKIKNPSDPSAGYATESTSGTYKFGLSKNPEAPGGWQITGYQVDASIDDVSGGIN